jgi:hypothetical protein
MQLACSGREFQGLKLYQKVFLLSRFSSFIIHVFFLICVVILLFEFALYVFNLLSLSTFYHSFTASMRFSFSSFIIICCIITTTLVLLSYSNHITITTTATTITFSYSSSITGYTKCEDELDELSHQYRNDYRLSNSSSIPGGTACCFLATTSRLSPEPSEMWIRCLPPDANGWSWKLKTCPNLVAILKRARGHAC